jgi:branched-chain amino acid transport system ATP-binding protein
VVNSSAPSPDSNPKSNDLLVVENLDIRYGAVQVLWDISFTVAKGKVTCIIGANGAGKTSTLNTIAGVLRVKKGKILLGGKDITRIPAHERVKCQISLVPVGRQLWPSMSVEDNLLMGCFPRNLRERAPTNLARIFDLFPRLRERRRQLAGTLSGGEQQMCAIGRGLMSDPKLLMLDEPSLGLAPILVDEVFELIRNIGKQGVTILLVGQNVNYTLQVSHYGYVMEVGRITLHGPSDMLSNNEHVRAAYLGGATGKSGGTR